MIISVYTACMGIVGDNKECSHIYAIVVLQQFVVCLRFVCKLISLLPVAYFQLF